MPRILRIVTSSLATLEAVAPPFNLQEPDEEENLRRAESILETAEAYKPDIVLLPETFKMAGMSSARIKDIAEPIDGPTVRMLSEHARNGNYNLIAGHMLAAENGHYTNSALVFNRQGGLLGKYDKNYPVEGEINCGINPGTSLPVFDLDCSRIGVTICFDINWPSIWSQLANAGVDLIAWISAYEGGFPLKSYAWVNQVPIVTSVMPYHGRVIDITGEIVASTSRWSRVVSYDFNLDRELFHTDNQIHKFQAIQSKYGSELDMRTYTEEHMILIANKIEGKTIKDIAEEFELESYKDYLARCTQVRNANISN